MQTYEEHEAWVRKFKRQMARGRWIEEKVLPMLGVAFWGGIALYTQNVWTTIAAAGFCCYVLIEYAVAPLRADIQRLNLKIERMMTPEQHAREEWTLRAESDAKEESKREASNEFMIMGAKVVGVLAALAIGAYVWFYEKDPTLFGLLAVVGAFVAAFVGFCRLLIRRDKEYQEKKRANKSV